jgi:7,8-dihydropterin-6-yl-methyl-4-(beta-D-ribofuranosyl)aminobenzene 5'-phosphate synthase
MVIKITTLSENTVAAPRLLAEWGLSIHVETDEMNVLLDTGQSVSAAYNADVLGIDLSKIDKIVLSHGHHDHTGGLREVLGKMRKKIDIIAHPDIWAAKYGKRPEQKEGVYCGIPFQRLEIEKSRARFIATREPMRLSENIMTTGEIPMITDFEPVNQTLCIIQNGKYVPDPLLDDQAIIITTGEGLVIVLGCAHRGMINTIYHARNLTGIEKVAMVIGGCHLHDASEERIWQTIGTLKELGVGKIGVSHCTGMRAAVIMAQEFGDGFFFNNAGTRIELE